MARFRSILSVIIACTWLWLPLAVPSLAAEPVEVIVEGIEGDVLANVQKALSLPAGLIREGAVDRLWLEHFERQAAGEVHAAMEPFGFYNARVTSAIETGRAGEYRLRVRVEPGEPVRLTGVRVAVQGPGTREKQLLELAAGFPLREGDVLLQQKYEEAKGALMSRAQDLGYLDAAFTVHEIRIAKSPATARIDLVLATGEQYLFDGVRIEGAPAYPEKFLRRYLAFRPDEVFSFAKLGQTQLNLANSERFKEVIVTPEKEAAREFRVPVLVQLNPAPRRRLRPGIGYGTDTGGRFTLRYRDLNMFLRGHELDANLYIAERLQGVATAYTIPSSKAINSFTGLQLNLQREEATTFTSELISAEVNRNRAFGRGEVGTVYLRVQQEDFTIASQESSARLVMPGIRLVGNHYDNPVRPTRGHRYALEMRGTHQYLGSDTGLLQFIAEGNTLVPLPWRLALFMRAKGGITLPSDPLRDIPPSLRFFAGGDNSVRGYTYRSLGPRDANGLVVGGKHLIDGSIELRRQLFEKWGVSLFYDAGNAFSDFTGVRLFQGVGAGIHYYTPVGALNFYLARQIGVAEPAFHIHFTVGFEL